MESLLKQIIIRNNTLSSYINQLSSLNFDQIKSVSGADIESDTYYEVYSEFFNDQIKWFRLLKLMPAALLMKFRKEPLIYYELNRCGLIADGFIKLKDIYLKDAENNHEIKAISPVIIDTMTQYLLSLDLKGGYSFFDFFEGPYEYENVVLEKGDIVMDIGANIGDFSFLSAVKGCRAYAFEPSGYIIDNYLKINIKKNSMEEMIEIAPYALSNEKGTATFKIDHNAILSGKIDKNNKFEGETEVVELTTIDDYVNENNISSVDFLKADIEGAERYMLQGAQSVLREFGPKIAICTYHLPDDPQVLEELVMDANPKYKIEHKYKKMYAYVPK